MKKSLTLIIAIGVCYLFTLGCHKKSETNAGPDPGNPTDTLSAFAKNLAATCTSPFSAQGDSSELYLPTAFTPNGDGINDVFDLLGKNCTFSSYLLTIYKTNGTKVFQTTSSTSKWFGVDTAGVKCTDYKYYVKIKYTTTGNHVADTGTYLYILPTNTSLGCVTAVAADKPTYKFPDEFNTVTFTFSNTTSETFCP